MRDNYPVDDDQHQVAQVPHHCHYCRNISDWQQNSFEENHLYLYMKNRGHWPHWLSFTGQPAIFFKTFFSIYISFLYITKSWPLASLVMAIDLYLRGPFSLLHMTFIHHKISDLWLHWSSFTGQLTFILKALFSFFTSPKSNAQPGRFHQVE